MARMMTHDQASELLGALALDAVEADEALAVEEHVATCPRCRDELNGHREVVGMLANTGQDAPEGMWDRIAARLHDSGIESADAASASSTLPSLRLMRVDPGAETPAPAANRWRRRRTRVALIASAAAVAAIAALGVEVVRLQDQTTHMSGQIATALGPAQPTMASVRQALHTPGSRHVVLSAYGHHGDAQLQAVIMPSGVGYLYSPELTPLSSQETYQLWGVVGDSRVSYGVLGSDPAPVMSFRASTGVQALAVTAEVSGGVVTSTHAPVVVGSVS